VLVTTYGFNVNFEAGSMRSAALMQYIDEVKNPWHLSYGYLQASQFSGIENREIRKKYLLAALAAFKKIGVLHEQGITYQLLGMQAAAEMDYPMAIEYTRSALGFFEQVGDLWGVDQSWTDLADFYIYSGQIPEAFHAFEVTRNFNEKSGNRAILGHDLSWESLAVSRYGKLEDALKMRQRSLELAMEVDNQHEVAWHTWELGEIYRLMGDLERAKYYYEAAQPQFTRQNDTLGLGFYHRGYGEIALMQGDWAKARSEFEQALEVHQGEQRQFRTWGLIYYHTRLAMAAARLGDTDTAREHTQAALSLVNSWPYPDMKAFLLMGIASLLAAQGSPGEAIEVAACIIHQPTTWNEVKENARQIIDEARTMLADGEVEASIERGENLRLDEMIERYLRSD
jgi:tetratricopeptide (TPR) repeat protein